MPPFRPFSLYEIKPKGWFLAQIRRDLEEGFASRLDTLSPHANRDLFKNRIASSQDQVAWWDSETRGNWLWGYVMAAYLSGLPEQIARVKILMDDLLATQDDDGYIGIYSPEWRYQHPAGENGELWGQSRALLPMLAYYEFSGDKRYLDAVEKAVALTVHHYHEKPVFVRSDDPLANITGLTHGFCYMDVVEWLYRITKKPEYRAFGIWLLDDFNRMPIPFPNDDLANANLMDTHRPFSGHAVHTVEHLRGLIWGATTSQNPTHLEGMKRAFHKLGYFQTPSGAVVGDESIHGLPMPDIGYEYCTLTELLMSLCGAIEHLGEARFGDMVETIAFNSAQGARFSDGKGISYLTSDTRLSATNARPDSYSYMHGHGGRFKYSPTHDDIACCCNPNSIRLMPHYTSRMWLRHDEGVVAILYGACELNTTINGMAVQINETTDYPFNNAITFTISPKQDVEFELMLRKPKWAKQVHITCQNAHIEEKDNFYHIHKVWQQGDSIEIIFTADIHLIPYPNDEYSLHYGALQFALPIAHNMTAIKSYLLENFHDYDITPQHIADAYHIPILDESQPNYGLSIKEVADMNKDYPWDAPPVQLEGYGTRFIPFGGTVLRRASFPLKKS